MAIGAKQPEVFLSIIQGIAVNVIDFERYRARHRVAFTPTASGTLIVVLSPQVPLDVARYVRRHTVYAIFLASLPALDILLKFVILLALVGVELVARAEDLAAAPAYTERPRLSWRSHGGSPRETSRLPTHN